LSRVEEKESNLAESLKTKSNKRQQVEAEIWTASQTETRLKEQLELETETGNRPQMELQELKADVERKEQELRNVKDELAELTSALDEAKLDEAQRRERLEKEREKVACSETELDEVCVRDETLSSLVDKHSPSHRSIDDSSLPTV